MPDVRDPSPLLDAAGIALPSGAAVVIAGVDPVLSSRHHVGEAAAAAAASAAAWAARHHEIRGGPAQPVRVDVDAAAATLLGFVFQSADSGIDLMREFSPVTALFRTADGRHIHLHGGFPHLADGTGRLLGCLPETDALRAAVAGWDAEDLEDALAAAGLCGAVVRTSDEWAVHPHGRVVLDLPAIRLTRLGDADPETATPTATAARPLAGVRVLDLTRVLAGPTAGRTLAGHGADVLRVDCPTLPTIEAFDIDTGRGKRSAFCDLDDPAGASRLLDLVDRADIVVGSYRPGSLDRRGLGPDDLARRRPGIVVVQLSCYGPDGPWTGRRGWEQLAQAASGIAHAENPDRPRLIPAAATDYTTGYLAAAGAIEALCRRAEEGGSWLVEVSLCQTAAWLTRLGADLDPDAATGLGDVAARQQQTASAWGMLTHLAPIEQMPLTPARWDAPPLPRGSSTLGWVTDPG